MKQVSLKLYKFDELSVAAQKFALRVAETAEMEDQWWDGNYEDFKMIGPHLGVEFKSSQRRDAHIFFRGFSSQGDGACFEGDWRAKDVDAAALRDHAPIDEELHRIVDILDKAKKLYPDLSYSIEHRDRYYHEHSVDFNETSNYPDDLPEAEMAAMDKIMAEVREALRDFMRWMYRQLEKTNDYLHSEEYIKERLQEAGEVFLDTGRIFRHGDAIEEDDDEQNFTLTPVEAT